MRKSINFGNSDLPEKIEQLARVQSAARRERITFNSKMKEYAKEGYERDIKR